MFIIVKSLHSPLPLKMSPCFPCLVNSLKPKNKSLILAEMTIETKHFLALFV